MNSDHKIKNKQLKFWINKIINFFRTKDFKIDPIPNIIFNAQPNDEDNILISTGNYQYATQTINLFVDNRHIKDLLRSFCHEMIHHHQYLENPDYFKRIHSDGGISNNYELREIESEAYLLGNLYFREFTETFTHQK